MIADNIIIRVLREVPLLCVVMVVVLVYTTSYTTLSLENIVERKIMFYTVLSK